MKINIRSFTCNSAWSVLHCYCVEGWLEAHRQCAALKGSIFYPFSRLHLLMYFCPGGLQCTCLFFNPTKEPQKTAFLALCLSPAAKSDALLDLPQGISKGRRQHLSRTVAHSSTGRGINATLPHHKGVPVQNWIHLGPLRSTKQQLLFIWWEQISFIYWVVSLFCLILTAFISFAEVAQGDSLQMLEERRNLPPTSFIYAATEKTKHNKKKKKMALKKKATGVPRTDWVTASSMRNRKCLLCKPTLRHPPPLFYRPC